MTGLTTVAVAIAGIAGPGRPALAQDDMADVKIGTVEVAPGIHMLTGRGGNIGVSTGSDGVALIDDQYAPLSERILAAVGKLQQGPVRFVVNTHGHGDHTGGNEPLGRSGALIVAHDAVRRRMSVDQFMKAFDRQVPAAPPAALPVVTFGIDTTLHWNGESIHAIHVPRAHTDGDAIVHFEKANVLHLGDVYFAGRYPFIDLDSGGSLVGMIQAVDLALGIANPKTRIIPGHGPLSDRAGLVAYRDVLTHARERISDAIEAGKSLEQVLAEKPLAEFDAEWGSGFITPDGFLKIVYTSLSGPGS
jgi:glyoxylase-like metal-dependent hydrolase (beta-lactamase superfamily II)